MLFEKIKGKLSLKDLKSGQGQVECIIFAFHLIDHRIGTSNSYEPKLLSNSEVRYNNGVT